MKVKMFSVFDSGAQVYLRPFFMVSTGEAVRGFITTLNDGQSEMSKYPQDFTLFEIGDFDDETCKVSLANAPISLGNGLHMKQKINRAPVAQEEIK